MAKFFCPLNNCNVEHEGSFELIVPMAQMHIISSHKKNVSQDDVFTLIANQAVGNPTLPLSMRDPEPVVVETPVGVPDVTIVEPEMNPPVIVVDTALVTPETIIVNNEAPPVVMDQTVSTTPATETTVVVEPVVLEEEIKTPDPTPEVVETPKEVKDDPEAKIADWWKKMKK